jgi:hypothetical protein
MSPSATDRGTRFAARPQNFAIWNVEETPTSRRKGPAVP